MADQAVSEMISAFAAGCMDKENFIHFNNYIRNNGELPYKELGKLQIITSMLPSILEQEEPDPELKNRVARRLISMQDEIKEKIKQEKQKTVEFSKIKTEIEPETAKTSNGIIKEKQKEGFANSAEKNKIYNKPNELLLNDYMNKENRLFTEKPGQPVEIPSQTPLWIILAILCLIIALIGYFTFTSNSELKDRLSKAENNIAAVKSEMRGANEFISKNVALVEFFNLSDVWIVPISGIDPLMKISGRIFLALKEREALLQINNLPTPNPDNTYQIWMATKNQSYSMGYFFVEPGNKYVKLINIPVIAKDQIMEFKITIEPRSGSVTPTGQVYASGIAGEAVKNPSKK